MKIKTSELIGPALDWAVAKCEGCSEKRLLDVAMWSYMRQQGAFRYSTDWSQGGQIIEREKLKVVPIVNGMHWYAQKVYGGGLEYMEGPTPLIAAMRCFVASKLGDEVDVPEELLP